MKYRCVTSITLWAVCATFLPSALPAIGETKQEWRSKEPLQEIIYTNQLDLAHRAMSLHVLNLASRIDEFFVDDRTDTDITDTYLRISPAMKIREKGELDFKYKVRLRLDFPHLKEKLHLIVDSFSDPDVPRTVGGDIIGEDDTFAGLRYRAIDENFVHVSLDGGLKYSKGPEAFIRLRGRREFEWDNWALRFTEDLFWFTEDGLAERTRMDFDRVISGVYFFRSSSHITWSEISEGVDWGQSISLFRYSHLASQRAQGVILGIHGHTHPSFQTDEVELAYKFRRLVHRDWLFMELVPRAEFPHERDFKFTPSLTIQFDVVLGNLKAHHRH